MTTVYSNKGHELHINIVELEESDIYQRLKVKQTTSWAKEAHKRAKHFLHGNETIKGHKKLLDEARSLLEKEHDKIRGNPQDTHFSHYIFEWHDPEREARFKHLKDLCKKAQHINHSLLQLGQAIQKAKIFETKYSEFLTNFHKQSLTLESHLRFFIPLFSVYDKTETRLQAQSYLHKLESDHSLPEGTITPDYVHQNTLKLLDEFDKVTKETEQMMKYLEEIVELETKVKNALAVINDTESKILDLEVKVKILIKWQKEYEEKQKIASTPEHEINFLLQKIEKSKISLDEIVDSTTKAKEHLENLTKVLNNCKDIKIFESSRELIESKTTELQSRLEETESLRGGRKDESS